MQTFDFGHFPDVLFSHLTLCPAGMVRGPHHYGAPYVLLAISDYGGGVFAVQEQTCFVSKNEYFVRTN